MTLNKDSRIYVAGHTGLFGSALVRRLEKHGFTNLLTVPHDELDLTDEDATKAFFREESPEYVYVAAAKVGGIKANNEYMLDFCMENMLITCNVLKSAHETNVKKLLYLGSSCIYPRESSQPVKEEYILTGIPEPTNEGYAIAKIAGIRMCDYYKKQYGDSFISCIPANVYGPNDDLNEDSSHVIPALLQRFIKAKREGLSFVEIWGTGKAEREFLYIDDAAEACILLMNKYDGPGTINIGTGKTTSIRELAEKIRKVVGYTGEIKYDITKPDGMPRRLLDSDRMFSLGWHPTIELEEGLKIEYDWILEKER
jgi:GDP-L-fucose synthase